MIKKDDNDDQSDAMFICDAVLSGTATSSSGACLPPAAARCLHAPILP